MASPDETPTPRLSELHLKFADEAKRAAEELGGVEMRLSRDPHFHDLDEWRFARALRTVLELHAKRFDKWMLGGVESARKAKQLSELQSLCAAAKEFIEEHRK